MNGWMATVIHFDNGDWEYLKLNYHRLDLVVRHWNITICRFDSYCARSEWMVVWRTSATKKLIFWITWIAWDAQFVRAYVVTIKEFMNVKITCNKYSPIWTIHIIAWTYSYIECVHTCVHGQSLRDENSIALDVAMDSNE